MCIYLPQVTEGTKYTVSVKIKPDGFAWNQPNDIKELKCYPPTRADVFRPPSSYPVPAAKHQPNAPRAASSWRS